MNENPVSPPWNRPVKIGVAVATVLFMILVLYRFQALLSSVIIGAIIAYLMHPIIEFFNRRTKLERSTITALTYLVLVIIFISIFAVAGVTLYRQASSLVQRAPEIISSIPERIETFNARIQEPIAIGNFELPPIPIESQPIILVISSLSSPPIFSRYWGKSADTSAQSHWGRSAL